MRVAWRAVNQTNQMHQMQKMAPCTRSSPLSVCVIDFLSIPVSVLRIDGAVQGAWHGTGTVAYGEHKAPGLSCYICPSKHHSGTRH